MKKARMHCASLNTVDYSRGSSHRRRALRLHWSMLLQLYIGCSWSRKVSLLDFQTITHRPTQFGGKFHTLTSDFGRCCLFIGATSCRRRCHLQFLTPHWLHALPQFLHKYEQEPWSLMQQGTGSAHGKRPQQVLLP